MGKNFALRMMESVRNLGFLSRNGFQFQGNRDLYNTYGYSQEITHQAMKGKYQRQDIAKRIINAPADAIWCDPPTVTLASFQPAFDQMIAEFNLWQIFNRVDKLAGMGEYATILFGFDDGLTLDQPVSLRGKTKVIYLQPYGQQRLIIESYITDAKSPRFGKPEFYKLSQPSIQMGRIVQQFGGEQTQRVHYSRVLHIVENPLEDEIFGNPRLGNVYNLLEDLLKIAGGSAEIYWLNARAGLHIDIDKEMQLEPDDEATLTAEVEDYVNNLTRVIRTRGTKVDTLNSSMADPRQAFQVTMALLAGATGMPQRILMGAEAGQLSSEQDRANWSNTIEERRQNFAVPHVIIKFLTFCSMLGMLKIEEVQKATVDWPEAFKLSPLERSQTSAQQARSAANLSKAMLQTPELVGLTESRKIIAGWAPQLTLIPDEKVPESEQISPQDVQNAKAATQPFGGGGTTKDKTNKETGT